MKHGIDKHCTPCPRWLFPAIVLLLCALSLHAQPGSIHGEPIPITLGNKFTLITDTRDTREWGGTGEYKEGMDINYALQITEPTNVVIHTLGSKVFGTSILCYSSEEVTPQPAVTQPEYVNWLKTVNLWDNSYYDTQDIFSGINLRPGNYTVVVKGVRVTNGSPTDGIISTTFISYKNNDFLPPFAPPRLIDGTEQQPIDIGSKQNSFRYSHTQPYELCQGLSAFGTHGCYYKLNLKKKFVIKQEPDGASSIVRIQDAGGQWLTLPEHTDSLILRKGIYTLVAEGNKFLQPISMAISGTLIPAETDPDATYDDMITDPDLSAARTGAVGSIKGAFNVAGTGAATYTMNIETPRGINGMQPAIALAYNSQSGNGLAGMGTGITGLSSITRASTDIYHDGTARGITHTAEDALYLDGRRLLYVSGIKGGDGCIYSPEGDPYVNIVLHGSIAGAGTGWFEYRDRQGTVYKYGNTPESRQQYTTGNGQQRNNVWYLSRCEDLYGNYMTYNYERDNLMVYPVRITYGENTRKSTGLTNAVEFSYKPLGTGARIFRLGDAVGKANRLLDAIHTKSNGQVYRSYSLDYIVNHHFGDYPQLTAVTAHNGNGEALPPTTFAWENNASSAREVRYADISIPQPGVNFKIHSSTLSATDLTGNGLADIVWMGNMEMRFYNPIEMTETIIPYFQLYVYPAYCENGIVKYNTPLTLKLPPDVQFTKVQMQLGGTIPIDFNGDGYNDIVIPQSNIIQGLQNTVDFYMISGKNISENRISEITVSANLFASAEMPCLTAADIDLDGKDEIFMIEKGSKNGKYPLSIMSCLSTEIETSVTRYIDTLWVTLPDKPQRLFVADYNNDALPDLFVRFENSYKIFFNNGQEGKKRYSDEKSLTGTDLPKTLLLEQGDFDGDGLTDFLYNTGGPKYHFAINQGNGTFAHSTACELDLYDQKTHSDDNRFTCMVTDMNHDGRADVIIAKAMYENSGNWTGFSWLQSTGTELKEIKKTRTNREDDASPQNLSVADFHGNGNGELLVYGHDIYNTDTKSDSIAVRIYGTKNFSASTNKVANITDGYGNKIHIDYVSLTDSHVHSKGNDESTFPLNDIVLPLPVVRHTTASNGVAENINKTYHYGNLKIHRQGRGVLGFDLSETEDSLTDTKIRTEVLLRDPQYYHPVQTRETVALAADTAYTLVTQNIIERGDNYFIYTSQKETLDMDGNKSVVNYTYDPEKGVILSEHTAFEDGSMYKKAQFSGFEYKGGNWQPTQITLTQRHPDDDNAYTDIQKIRYDDYGKAVTAVSHAGKELEVITHRTYDGYGNLLSERNEGKGMANITAYYEYDPTARFVTHQFTSPATTATTYTYNIWGQVLTQTDVTNGNDGPRTTCTYDEWGNKKTETLPTGIVTKYANGWLSENNACYFMLEQKDGAPWTKTVYDATGRTLRKETVGQRGMLITTHLKYNHRGECVEQQTRKGKLTRTETREYDIRGRVIRVANSAGKSEEYAYGKRSITTTTNGRTYTKTTDAWGNITTSADPLNTVTYRYGSNGKLIETEAAGSTVTSEYDDVGNQTVQKDADAGCTTYEYDAAGRVIKQTDARGKVTTNTYDDQGRLIKTDVDGTETTYIYGTTGNSNQRLIKELTGNKAISYEYDVYGRVLTEKRTMPEATLITANTYNEHGMMGAQQITYYPTAPGIHPSEFTINYSYDPYGNLLETHVGDSCVWKLAAVDGLTQQTELGTHLRHKRQWDERGYLTKLALSGKSRQLHAMEFAYDGATSNLLSRKGMLDETESFEYDELDRLVQVNIGNSMASRINYGDNGNITDKTGLGNYHYDTDKPHAVTGVDNPDGIIPPSQQETVYNGFGKIMHITDAGTGYMMDIDYGPDQERWTTHLYKDSALQRRMLYFGDVEVREEYTNGQLAAHTLYCYIGNGVIKMQRQSGGITDERTLYAFTDYLGSVLDLYDSEGQCVFAATYDAWGNQAVRHNEIDFYRGYTGHEMLPEFGLINMNGRLYDSTLGVFLSPDNYIQSPENSQNYNRYSYCLNNPLKYTDPSGEISQLGLFTAFTILSAFSSGARAQANGKSFWSGALMGAIRSVASYGIGQLFGAAGSFSHELLRAGTHGVVGGVLSGIGGDNWLSGAISSMGSSLMGSFAQTSGLGPLAIIGSTTVMGGLLSLATGGSFYEGAINGLVIGAMNFAEHGIDSDGPGDITYHHDKEGNLYGEIPQVDVYPNKEYKEANSIVEAIGCISSGITILEGLNDYISSCRIGSNGKIYLPTNHNKVFYGNQYVTTSPIKGLNEKLLNRISSFINIGENAIRIYEAYIADGYKIGVNCKKHFCKIIGKAIGATLGRQTGLILGTVAGVSLGGYGAVPGRIIGGIAGKFAGEIAGEYLGGALFDLLYK